MRILKNYQYILSFFVLLFVVNIGFASSTPQQMQEQEQERGRKSDQTMMRPDAGATIDPGQEEEPNEETEQNSDNQIREIYIPVEKIDSVKEEESVSKYNFLFYFLYKFKYDGEETP